MPDPTQPAAAPAPKKAFGGYAVSFAGRRETLEQVFGTTPLPPSEMTKKLWAFVKANKLSLKM
jgi:hypothetical protein